ncbi:MAG: hypothetical protein H0Z19_07250 [Archaeoglobus sp.]|uniref:hypothetical protein n=1 Tax=Archaeoglobus sp. TaxID=1872626 RepID=UPI001D5C75A8|nr:hypothetical protein [Archaeoglobus sp.]MBO8180260.1 hypothetical protein [Archaeoglobus sp.]
MAKRLIAELIIKGALCETPEEDTIKEDVNPPNEGAVFTAFNPEADGMAITEQGDVQIAFGNQCLNDDSTTAPGWTAGDYMATYSGKLVPTEPLDDFWTITGDLEISTSEWGYQSAFATENKLYFGIGDPATNFIGLKLKWTLGRGAGSLYIYIVSVFDGSENATLLRQIDTGEEAVTATGTFTLHRIDETTYQAELEIWGGGTDSRNGTFTNPDITVYSEDSYNNYLCGQVVWKNLNRS